MAPNSARRASTRASHPRCEIAGIMFIIASSASSSDRRRVFWRGRRSSCQGRRRRREAGRGGADLRSKLGVPRSLDSCSAARQTGPLRDEPPPPQPLLPLEKLVFEPAAKAEIGHRRHAKSPGGRSRRGVRRGPQNGTSSSKSCCGSDTPPVSDWRGRLRNWTSSAMTSEPKRSMPSRSVQRV